jgi:hypothetical protein
MQVRTDRRLLAPLAVPLHARPLHGDAVKSFIVTRERDRPGGLSYVGAAALTTVYLAADYQRVVIDFVFEQPAHVDRFRTALGTADAAVVVCTLWAPLAVITAREADRLHRERLGPQVAASWQAINTNLHNLGVIIDANRPIDDVLLDLESQLHRWSTT